MYPAISTRAASMAAAWHRERVCVQYTGNEMKLACCGACQICCVAFW
jgi:hypothetical protein